MLFLIRQRDYLTSLFLKTRNEEKVNIEYYNLVLYIYDCIVWEIWNFKNVADPRACLKYRFFLLFSFQNPTKLDLHQLILIIQFSTCFNYYHKKVCALFFFLSFGVKFLNLSIKDYTLPIIMIQYMIMSHACRATKIGSVERNTDMLLFLICCI